MNKVEKGTPGRGTVIRLDPDLGAVQGRETPKMKAVLKKVTLRWRKTFCPEGRMVFQERDVWCQKVRIICSNKCPCSVKSPHRLTDLCLAPQKICAQHMLCALGISYISMSTEAPRRWRPS